MPHYAVIFLSQLKKDATAGYGEMAEKMVELARTQPGFLGVESVRGLDGRGITVSYWDSEEAIARWKAHAEHRVAQSRGKSDWYERYRVQIARIEREYEHLSV